MANTTTTNNGAAPTAQENSAMIRAAESSTGSIDVFASQANFEGAQRMAKAMASSTLVPQAYQNNLPNVLIAMELAARIRASVFAIMQNIDIIHGRPSWRATFLIATVNACGRFTPIRYRFQGKEGTAEWGCRAVAKDRENGEECVGALITMSMATAEGWSTKSGSKWKTMPEQMLMYRAAAFWTRVYAPELSLGMRTTEEVIDVEGIEVTESPDRILAEPSALEAALLAKAPSSPDVNGEPIEAKAEEKTKRTRAAKTQEHDPVTGEIVPDAERQPGDD